MKKQHTLALLLLAGLALGSCSSDDSTEPNKPSNEVKTYHATTVANMGENGTRTLSLDGATLNVGWATYEEVYVFPSGEDNYLGTMKPTVIDGTAATLVGDITSSSIEAGDVVILRFPQEELNYSGQTGTLDDLAKDHDFAELETTIESVYGDNVTIKGGTFVSRQAIVKFTFTDGTDPIDFRDGTMTISGSAIRGETVDLSPASQSSDIEHGVIYAALPIVENASATTLTISGTTNFLRGEKSYTGTKYISIPMENGKFYTATVTLTAE